MPAQAAPHAAAGLRRRGQLGCSSRRPVQDLPVLPRRRAMHLCIPSVAVTCGHNHCVIAFGPHIAQCLPLSPCHAEQ